MSHALSIAAKIRHRLLFALSPRYRRIRARLNEIAATVPFRPTDEPAILPLGRPDYRGPGGL